jgi:hypothetical protein
MFSENNGLSKLLSRMFQTEKLRPLSLLHPFVLAMLFTIGVTAPSLVNRATGPNPQAPTCEPRTSWTYTSGPFQPDVATLAQQALEHAVYCPTRFEKKGGGQYTT